MLVTIDTEKRTVQYDQKSLDLYSDAAFELLSDLWLKVGWNQKHIYTFSWFGFFYIPAKSNSYCV